MRWPQFILAFILLSAVWGHSHWSVALTITLLYFSVVALARESR